MPSAQVGDLPVSKSILYPAPEAVFYTESGIAQEFGISVTAVKSIRSNYLEAVTHFYRDGGSVRINELGHDLITEILHEKKGGGESPTYHTLVVVKADIMNHMVVSAKAPGSQQISLVRVKHNENFKPGLVIRNCRFVRPGVYHYEGRTPRQPGRI